MQEEVFQMYLDEIKELESLDAAANRMLLSQVAEGSQEARNRLIEGNLKAVLLQVQNYLNRGVQAGDLVQEANMALIMAVAEYESGDFEPFLQQRVKEALQAAVDEQSKEVQIREKMVSRVNALEEVAKEMAQQLGREAKVEELAERMKLTSDEIRDIMKETLNALSVNGEYTEEEPEE